MHLIYFILNIYFYFLVILKSNMQVVIFIYYDMILSKLKLNQKCVVKAVKVCDPKINLRLQELGLYTGAIVIVHKYSPLKKTILVQIFNSLFAMKCDIAKNIFVEEIQT